MAIDPLVAPLLRVELFQGLKPLQITEIARTAERMVYREGEAITVAGDPGEAAFLVVAGACEWVDNIGSAAGEPIEIGSMIGEMAMFIEHTYGATVVARGQVRCLKINREMMHQLMLEDRGLAQHLTEKIALRLHRVGHELRTIDAVVDDGDAFMTDVGALDAGMVAQPALQLH
jgi:CRP-like cAMP-binding protein